MVGLPKKNGIEKPLYDYQETIFDTLKSNKHIWIKKTTGLGITEFFLRCHYEICQKNIWECDST